MIGAAHIHRLYQEPARHDLFVRVVELNVQREGAVRKEPELFEIFYEVVLVCNVRVQILLIACYVVDEATEPALGVDRSTDVLTRFETAR